MGGKVDIFVNGPVGSITFRITANYLSPKEAEGIIAKLKELVECGVPHREAETGARRAPSRREDSDSGSGGSGGQPHNDGATSSGSRD